MAGDSSQFKDVESLSFSFIPRLFKFRHLIDGEYEPCFKKPLEKGQRKYL